MSGRKKILMVSHAKFLRAFASSGADPDRFGNFLNTFFFENTDMTPFKVGIREGSEQATFVHNRPDNTPTGNE